MNKKNVLVALADRNYLNQAKQLFSTVYWNSGWSGDYLLLAYEVPESELTWFINKGIKVKHCESLNIESEKIGDKITACKILLFSEYFKKWDNVIYLDVDIITRGSIQGLTNDFQGFSACYSLGQTLRDNLVDFSKIPSDILNELNRNFDLNRKAFNSGVIAFPTFIIKENMVEDLLTIFNRYVKYGLFGGDQLPFNIYFYDSWFELPQAYNQIVPLHDYSYNKDLLQGLIIHCVSFGNGPWDPRSLFFKEWQSNLNKADLIDLKKIPTIHHPSEKEIRKRSKSVVTTYLMGGTMRPKVIVTRMLQAAKIVFTNPSKIFIKIKGLLNN